MEKSAFSGFRGFSRETLVFLMEVRDRDSKIWFEDHRNEYNEYVLHPLQDLVREVSAVIARLDPLIETSPKKVISRIYRDIRFSKDKSLYRNDAWLSFKRRAENGFTSPEFYFYFTPVGYEYGMGYYGASKPTMDNFRKALERDPETFRKAAAFLLENGNEFLPVGNRYRATVKNTADEDLQHWFGYKSFALTRERKTDELFFSAALSEKMTSGFEKLAPLYTFLRVNTTSG